MGKLVSRLPTRLPILNTLKEKYADKVEFVGVAMISQKEPIENGKKYLKSILFPSTITQTLTQASKKIS